jgi:hypothetical protein
LAVDGKYKVKILTRWIDSPSALALGGIPNVTLIQGSSYNEADLHIAFKDVSIAFVNTNGFAIGEKAEIYWGIRIFELAAEHQVKHFIWASLASSYKISGFQARFRTGHFEGKQKVADWISAQGIRGSMKWSILTSCMYLEMLSEMLQPFPQLVDGEEVYVFQAPLGSGRPPMIYLADLGRYARWLADNAEKSNGMNLEIATEQVGWDNIAKSFTAATGKKAVFKDITLDEYFDLGIFPHPDKKVGHSATLDDTFQTYRQNFSGFWTTWKEDVLQRDYALLDQILPTRVRSVEQWMRITGYDGKPSSVLKDYADKDSKF